jgi:uncharacterized coiled-coil protein SlyX
MSDGMSDEEMDREWKPQGRMRPQSTMARSFSLALNDLFKIDNSIADLDAAVSEKKRSVSNQESELEALEARLRATEERLKQAASAGASPAKSSTGRSSPRPRPTLGEDTFASSPTRAGTSTHPHTGESRQTSRPNTSTRPQSGNAGRPTPAWKQEAHPSYTAPPMPGALPPTPDRSEASEGESESEYVVVATNRTSADIGKDGDMPPPPPQKG